MYSEIEVGMEVECLRNVMNSIIEVTETSGEDIQQTWWMYVDNKKKSLRKQG